MTIFEFLGRVFYAFSLNHIGGIFSNIGGGFVNLFSMRIFRFFLIFKGMYSFLIIALCYFKITNTAPQLMRMTPPQRCQFKCSSKNKTAKIKLILSKDATPETGPN